MSNSSTPEPNSIGAVSSEAELKELFGKEVFIVCACNYCIREGIDLIHKGEVKEVNLKAIEIVDGDGEAHKELEVNNWKFQFYPSTRIGGPYLFENYWHAYAYRLQRKKLVEGT